MQIERVLVPVDLSDCSTAAVDYGAFLGRELGAQIDVLHVWSPPAELAHMMRDLTVTDPEGRKGALAQVIRTWAGRKLKAALQRLEDEGVGGVRGRLAEGVPHRTIVEVADDGYDLVVMGTHGRTGLSRTLMGSVAERVVRRSPVPVLAVRRAARATSASASPAA